MDDSLSDHDPIFTHSYLSYSNPTHCKKERSQQSAKALVQRNGGGYYKFMQKLQGFLSICTIDEEYGTEGRESEE
jgi:hypothetical protein